MPSGYLQLALVLVLAVHTLGEEEAPGLGEEMYFQGTINGYVHSSVQPPHLSVIVFSKVSKKACAMQCNDDDKCKGFKYGGEGCSLMGVQAEPTPVQPAQRFGKRHSEKLADMVGKPLPIVSSRKKSQALVYLHGLVGKNKNTTALRALIASAEAESDAIDKGLHAMPRDTDRAELRARKILTRINKFNLKANLMTKAMQTLPAKAKRLIDSKLESLPANTEAGSQQHIANFIIRREWRNFKHEFDLKVDKVVVNEERGIVAAVKRMLSVAGADAMITKLRSKEESARKKWEEVETWQLSAANMGGDAIVSSTSSEFADNMPNCAKLSAMCAIDIRTRRQCAYTCRFVSEQEHEKMKAALEAKEVLIKRKDETIRDMRNQREKVDGRLQFVEQRTSEDQEMQVKLERKLTKLKKQQETTDIKTVVKVTEDPELEKAKLRDQKANALRKLALKLQNQGNRKVRAGRSFIERAELQTFRQRNATKAAGITIPVEIIDTKTGNTSVVEPDVEGSLEKAAEESPKIADNLESAIELVKTGEHDLRKAKLMLKEAVAVSQGKQFRMPAKKPLMDAPVVKGIPANPKKIAQLRKAMKTLGDELSELPSKSPKRKPILEKISQLKAEINRLYKPLPEAIEKPKDFQDMSGAGRKAVEGGPATKGEPFDVEKDEEKQQLEKGKNTLSGKVDEAGEEVKKAEKDVVKKLQKGGSRGHSAWKPESARGKGKRGVGKGKGKRKSGRKGIYKSLGETAQDIHSAITASERYISFDHERCNYQPPAGCGCEGSFQTQQTQPRELGEYDEVTSLDATDPPPVRPDPTSTGDCPAMPADCSCRASSAVVVLGEADQDLSTDADTSDLLSGIVCRVRTALAVAKIDHPELITKLEAQKAFVKHKQELAPLMSCVADAKETDTQCSKLLPALMDSVGSLMPAVQHVQHQLGVQYQRAVKEC